MKNPAATHQEAVYPIYVFQALKARNQSKVRTDMPQSLSSILVH